jgi:hypothetical protein
MCFIQKNIFIVVLKNALAYHNDGVVFVSNFSRIGTIKLDYYFTH